MQLYDACKKCHYITISHDFASKYKKHHGFMINCNIPGEKKVFVTQLNMHLNGI